MKLALRPVLRDLIKSHPVIASVAGGLLVVNVLRGFALSSGGDGSGLFIALGGIAILAVFFGLPAYVIFILGKGAVGKSQARVDRQRVAETTGYTPPVDWSDNGHDFVTRELLEQRASLPPFTVWYEEGVSDGTREFVPGGQPGQGRWPSYPTRTRWLAVTDGNSRLGSPGPDMPNRIQFQADGYDGLALFDISPEVAGNLNRNTYRTESVSMTHTATGKPCSYKLKMGSPATFVPPTPQRPSGNFGTGDQGDGSDQRHSN